MLIKLKPEEYIKTTLIGTREDKNKPYSKGYICLCLQIDEYGMPADDDDNCFIICYTTTNSEEDYKEFTEYCNSSRMEIAKRFSSDYACLRTEGASIPNEHILVL